MKNKLKYFFSWARVSGPMKNLIMFYVVLAILNLAAIGFIDPKYILLVDAFIFVLTIFHYFPAVGLYLMILLYPFTGWQFSVGSINFPYADLAALMRFSAVALKIIVK